MAKTVTPTPEQEAQIPKYVEKWLKLGLATARVKPADAQEVSDYYYRRFEKIKPVPVVLAPSPGAAWLMACLCETEKTLKAEDVVARVKELPKDTTVPPFVYPYIDGHYSAGYFSFYDFMLNCVGYEVEKELRADYEWYMGTHRIGPMYPLKHICIISDRPTQIHVKNNVLHSEKGPALEYSDGLRLWVLNGVTVPDWLVTTPWNKIDCKLVLKEKNAEVRREIVRKVGIERVCKELGSKLIDKGSRGEHEYELLELDLGDGRHRPWLKMLNPSTGTYHIEGVPPETRTVKAALAWREGNDLDPEVLT